MLSLVKLRLHLAAVKSRNSLVNLEVIDLPLLASIRLPRYSMNEAVSNKAYPFVRFLLFQFEVTKLFKV